jgi:hypothetical protein
MVGRQANQIADPEAVVYLVNFTDDPGAKSRAIVATSSSSRALPRVARPFRLQL